MQTVKKHLRAYPRMQPTDVIKLLYQRAFGAGHMISDPETVVRRLCEEYEEAAQPGTPFYTEDIGGGFSRLYLAGVPVSSLHTVGRLFLRSAAAPRRDFAGFEASLCAFTALVHAGETPFSLQEWETALDTYRAEGCPMVRHSPVYRAAYAPAYRVIAQKYVPLLPLLFAVDAKIAETGRAVLAIDGMCGSGKSTLARLLSSLYDAAVIAMDDFFLPPSLRTDARLQEAGGNIHYERFFEEVVPHLGEGHPFTYRAFDCSRMALGEHVEVLPRPLILVEGSYSLHPALRGKYDVTAYLHCTSETQIARLAVRCQSEPLLNRFRTEWIPMEMRYAEVFSVRDSADFVVDTTDMDFREEEQR